MTTTLPQALIAEIEHALATNGWTMVPEGTLVDDSMHGYWVNPQHVDRDHILAALCSVFSANPYYTCAWPGRSHAGWRTGTGNAYHPGLYLFAARRRPHVVLDDLQDVLKAFSSAVDLEVRCNLSQERAEYLWRFRNG